MKYKHEQSGDVREGQGSVVKNHEICGYSVYRLEKYGESYQVREKYRKIDDRFFSSKVFSYPHCTSTTPKLAVTSMLLLPGEVLLDFTIFWDYHCYGYLVMFLLLTLNNFFKIEGLVAISNF